ncbi:hypothetical protein [Mycobacterium sp. EPa45]|uniref:hypothetical protein n=1 Tax=Mycobacterium sp. EPa45 TaxID=1545728 RepID=UPI000641BABA|nr:hypothetical protein [Mycobacterium sp. EPa45]AKK25449.1 hypothetical protein AB431_00515 [Mycobacterium sp. EPa45]
MDCNTGDLGAATRPVVAVVDGFGAGTPDATTGSIDVVAAAVSRGETVALGETGVSPDTFGLVAVTATVVVVSPPVVPEDAAARLPVTDVGIVEWPSGRRPTGTDRSASRALPAAGRTGWLSLLALVSGAAPAVPWPPAKAPPTPNATANAPTRPT